MRVTDDEPRLESVPAHEGGAGRLAPDLLTESKRLGWAQASL